MDDTVLTHRDDIERREQRDQHRVSALQSKSMQHFVNHPPSAAMHATAQASARGPIPAHPGNGGLGGGANANSNSAFQV